MQNLWCELKFAWLQSYLVLLCFASLCFTCVAFFTNWREGPLQAKWLQLILLGDCFATVVWSGPAMFLKCACIFPPFHAPCGLCYLHPQFLKYYIHPYSHIITWPESNLSWVWSHFIPQWLYEVKIVIIFTLQMGCWESSFLVRVRKLAVEVEFKHRCDYARASTFNSLASLQIFFRMSLWDCSGNRIMVF